jgi:hypothetical protein
VTARTLLLAATAVFLNDPAGAWVRINERINHLKSGEIERWLSKHPAHLKKMLTADTLN